MHFVSLCLAQAENDFEWTAARLYRFLLPAGSDAGESSGHSAKGIGSGSAPSKGVSALLPRACECPANADTRSGQPGGEPLGPLGAT